MAAGEYRVQPTRWWHDNLTASRLDCFRSSCYTSIDGVDIRGKEKPMSGPTHRPPQIGEIYTMQFSGTGSEQRGIRPGLVFQNNVGNRHSPNIIALPLTSARKKPPQPTHVFVRASDSGLRVDSVILCENPERLSKVKIGRYITRLPDGYMRQVAIASLIASSVISFLDLDSLISAWEQALSLNGDQVSRARPWIHP